MLAVRPVLLAYRALGLGDLLTGVPALRALRRAFPGHRVVLAVPGPLGGDALRWGLADDVADVRPFAVPARGPVDVAVNLHGRGPQSTAALASLQPRRLLAFAGRGVAGPAWDDAEHEVRRWCRLLAWAGVDAGPLDLLLPGAVPGGLRDRVAVLHPGAASGARRWPASRFAEVAAGLAADGLEVVVTAGPGEEALAAAALGGAPGRVLAGAPLAEVEALLRRAAVCVVGDTGVGHLATACGTPAVHLFGPVAPSAWGPLRDPRLHVVLHRPAPGDPADPHAATCSPALLRIAAAEVLAAARGLVSS